MIQPGHAVSTNKANTYRPRGERKKRYQIQARPEICNLIVVSRQQGQHTGIWGIISSLACNVRRKSSCLAVRHRARPCAKTPTLKVHIKSSVRGFNCCSDVRLPIGRWIVTINYNKIDVHVCGRSSQSTTYLSRSRSVKDHLSYR